MFRAAALAVTLGLTATVPPQLSAEPVSTETEMSIAIERQRAKVRLAGTRGFLLHDLVRDREILLRHDATPLELETVNEGIRVAGVGTFSRMAMRPLAGSLLSVDGRRYRGWFRVEDDRFGRITVVNLVGVEDYLKGVIPAEMLVTSPMEALKAQAVVARTFALKHRDRFTRDRGYGLTADVESQVYRGFDGEDPRATQAVLETAGSVLHVGDHMVEGFYHQACGGRTQDNEDVWGGRSLLHLRAVDCNFCVAHAQLEGYDEFDWTFEISRTNLRAELMAKGYPLGAVMEVRQNLEPVGRASRLTLSHSEGELELSPSKLRHLVGSNRLKSSFFRLAHTTSPRPAPAMIPVTDPLAEASIRSIIGTYLDVVSPKTTISFEGRGFGHGVGLCQWGARRQAAIGKTHDAILRFYYKGVSVSPLDTLYSGD